MNRLKDPLLIILLTLLLLALLAFILGIIPYPYGLLVLLAFIAARIMSLQGPGK
jgi:hypothetical protein